MKASEIVDGLSIGNAAAASMTNLVLSIYINVIKETATALTRIGLQNEANDWYARGVSLADAIASNDTATQFFSLLRKHHLKSIIVVGIMYDIHGHLEAVFNDPFCHTADKPSYLGTIRPFLERSFAWSFNRVLRVSMIHANHLLV